MTEIKDLSPAAVEEIFRRFDADVLTKEDRPIVRAMMEGYILLGRAVKEKNGKIHTLLRMIFGSKTEKTRIILPGSVRKTRGRKTAPRGHGRNGASSYEGGRKTTVSHPSLARGDLCPECKSGKVYPTSPGVTVRITGNAPLVATSYECEKLRCNGCGEVFTAKPPGEEKYDPAAGAMIALLKYGMGVPFHRLGELQESMGIPLPASTQWDIVEKTAGPAHPAYRELLRQAAQGQIIHNDDTVMKVLLSINEKEGRKGTFTTGMLSVADERKIALFVTGHRHAGENLTDLLAKRQRGLDPPIQMADALSRNVPKELPTLLANCLAHARRNFVDVAESFPEECRHVIELLARVYEHDARTKEEKMSPEKRREYHQERSSPVMENLRAWMQAQFVEKRVEPNSGLGKAFSYMLNHWEPLTLFLRVPGAPLDNNICERALKMAIRHRRNSLFYRTLHGAYIGDLFMSLIHTCRLSKVNPLPYLVALQKYSREVRRRPDRWLPWNYEQAIAELPP
jgi:transposase